MAERRERVLAGEENFSRWRRWFLDWFQAGGKEHIALETERTREAEAARVLATGGTKKDGFWKGTGKLGAALGSILVPLGAFHGNEWLKKWMWGKNRAYWNSIIPALKGIKIAV